ncbi:MAG: hypothetical protein WB562_00665 [Candidatus Sulfotelmatobacter sp.]
MSSTALDSRAEDLVKDFTLSQLRELVGSVLVGRETGSLQSKSRDELINLLGTIGDAKKKALVAHRLEAITPYKHLYLYAPSGEIRYSSLASHCRRAFPSIINDFSPLPRAEADELHLQLCLLDDQAHRIFVKFAHQVTTWETVKTSGNQRTQRLVKKRHPVVLAIHCAIELVVITFPGYTQSGVTFKDRSTYAQLAKDAAHLFTEKSGLGLFGFQAKNAIEKLLADSDSGVVDIKRTLKPQGGGRIVVDSWENDGGLAKYFSEVLKYEGKLSVDANGVRTLLQEGDADDIWLLWTKLGMLTRFGIQQSVPEVMIVWREGGPDPGKIEVVLRELVSHLSAATPSDTLAAIEEIERSSVGTVITPNGLAQRHNLTTDDALRTLTGSASQRRVQVRFRVKTDSILDAFDNYWRTSLAEFPAYVTDEEGHILDLKDRSNIEVAFERVG